MKIGASIPDLEMKQLRACLREKVDLFAWFAVDMSRLDPEIACHDLTVDPAIRVVALCRHRQSPEKMVATEQAGRDLLAPNSISEAK